MTDILSPTFDDPVTDFDLERQKLARRRKIAENLIATEADAPKMMGNWVLNTGPMGGVAAAIGRGIGTYDQAKIEDQEKLLGAGQKRAERQLIEGIPAEQGQAREQAQYLAATQMPSLRNLISAQMAGDERQQIADANRIARREDLAIKLSSDAETKREHREDQQKFQEEQNRLYRRTAAQLGSSQHRDRFSVQQGPDGKMYRVNMDTGEGTPITIDTGSGKTTLTRPNAAERKTALVQDELIGKVNNALDELNKNPDAVGLKTFVPNVALQRFDPSGVQARSFISELGAEKAHELYGASFTAAERARADKFIPADGDDRATVIKKLSNMKLLAEQAKARAMGSQPATPTRRKWNAAKGDFE